MLIPIKVIPVAVIGFLLFTLVVAAQEKSRLAVLNFATRDSVEEAEAITEELRGAFVKSGIYTVIDRTQTEQILKEWETQQSGLTNDQKAIKIGKLHNVKLIVTGKLNKFAGGGWQVSAVMLDAQNGVTLKSERVRHRGDFFTLLDQKVPGLAMNLARKRSVPIVDQPQQPTQQYAVRTDAGSTWRDPVTGMDFVLVPGGRFEMGCVSGDTDCSKSEKTVRTVLLDEFWLGKYEVTLGEWRRVMGSIPRDFAWKKAKGDKTLRSISDDRYPAELISLDDAQWFILRLNGQGGSKYRLPSEAEWEYACRAGGKPMKYGTVNGSLNRRIANYGGSISGGMDDNDGYLKAAPVGSFDSNDLGLHDMAGNASEWVQGGFDKGGSFYHPPVLLRCSARLYQTPVTMGWPVGFRIVRVK